MYAININIILSINSTITIVNILLRIILFFNIFNIKYNLELRKAVTSKVIVLAKYILKLYVKILSYDLLAYLFISADSINPDKLKKHKLTKEDTNIITRKLFTYSFPLFCVIMFIAINIDIVMPKPKGSSVFNISIFFKHIKLDIIVAIIV